MADGEKNKMTLNIHGSNYTIRTTQESQKVTDIVEYVNQKMDEVARYQPKLNYKDVAVLAALNMAEEYLNLKEEYNQLVDIINEN